MGITYQTPHSYQSRQYAQPTGIHAFSSDPAGHYNNAANQRNRAHSDFIEHGIPSPPSNRLTNGAIHPSIPEKDIALSYPPEIRPATQPDIRKTHADSRFPHPLPPSMVHSTSREKRKGGRFFRRLIRPFRNLIKRPQPSEKFVETSQGWLSLLTHGFTP